MDEEVTDIYQGSQPQFASEERLPKYIDLERLPRKKGGDEERIRIVPTSLVLSVLGKLTIGWSMPAYSWWPEKVASRILFTPCMGRLWMVALR